MYCYVCGGLGRAIGIARHGIRRNIYFTQYRCENASCKFMYERFTLDKDGNIIKGLERPASPMWGKFLRKK